MIQRNDRFSPVSETQGAVRELPRRPSLAFLDYDSDMARCIAGYDWDQTPLGCIAGWPDHLRMAAGMMLRSPISMTLLWGEAGIMLYNDSYATGAGKRHPAILGRPVTEAWPEIADFNRHMLRTCLGGGSLLVKDHRFTIPRDGTPEDIWLDVAASPVPDALGRPAGVLVVVTDTTARNLADERLRFAQEAGRVGTFEWYPETHALVVSDVYRQLFGLAATEDVTQARLMELVLPEDQPMCDNLRFGTMDNPLVYAEFRIRHAATNDIRWIGRRGQVLQGGTGAPQRFIGIAWDITERKAADRQRAFLAELGDRLRELSDARQIVGIASEMLGRYLNADRAGYAEVEADGVHVTIEGDWTNGNLPSMAGRYRIGSFGALVVDALNQGETLRVDDMRTDARLQDTLVLQAFAAIGMRSGITVPLIRDGRFTGVLFAHCAERRAWTDGDEAVMLALAERTWDSTQRAKAEQRLRDSEEDFRLLAQAMPIQAWLADHAGRTVWVNQRAYDYTGVPHGDLKREDWTRIVHPDDRDRAFSAWSAAVRASTPCEYDLRMLRHDGAWRWHLSRAMPIRDEQGRVVRWIGTNTDIDDERRARNEVVQLNATLEERVEARTQELRQTEAALRQSQKMEAIGQLTGGIAHDFNNLLTGISGSLELVRRRLTRLFPETDARLNDLDRFMQAATSSAQRAAALTHRLLAFARRQSLDTRPTDVAELTLGMADLLRRTLGEQVALRIEADETGWHALTDPNQLESAILNLAINARDAMPAGGLLTIGAANVTLDRASAAAIGRLEPGDFVAIAVTDTGSGMPDEVREKAFDPFFTTKPTGQGTGLGLSMVYGFTRQSGGHVRLDSEPGLGTTVTLYLPRAADVAEPDAKPVTAEPDGAGETVLVVEDVPAVRMLIVEVLRDLGYETIEANDATEALPILGSSRPIDLLVSDVGLPGLNGRQIADYARARRPGLKVLFVTGYAGDIAVSRFGLEDGMAMITKPFAIEQLASKVNELLTGG